MRRFLVTDNHLKLLRRAYVTWNDCEFGAPSIDCKRPYGNSSVYLDMAEILGLTPTADDGEFSDEDYSVMRRLHEGTRQALEIILATGLVRPGTYVKYDDYGTDWRPE